ncbi:MAG TPA: hypothetical protein VFN49_02290 [Candidatus Aquilonibacter sp.]|nr:hypothetical protein [Candidatus Aquilonibacter sp.]
MSLSIRARARASFALAASLGLAIVVSACSGGGTASNLPASSPVHQSRGVKMLGHLTISRVDAAKVARLVRRASAYGSPVRGGHIQHLRTMTSSAGNDLTNNGGPVMAGANVYNILVNQTDESTWGGQIAQFENDLFGSGMINILDQYIGQSATGAFSYAGDVQVTYDTSQQLGDQDIYNIVYQVAKQYATGYNNIYNVFLDSTVSQCSQSAGGCYGQQYCAYHGNTDYSDIGHTIYSVEPYQNIQGCQISDTTGSPNGVLADSTASTLSHEMFEAFTDPDVPNNVAWYNNSMGEIGDICAPANGITTGVVTLGSDSWEIQPEYSNNVHDCSYSP